MILTGSGENMLKKLTQPSIIKDVERIIVINKGEIIEDGSHRKLINVKGKYLNWKV